MKFLNYITCFTYIFFVVYVFRKGQITVDTGWICLGIWNFWYWSIGNQSKKKKKNNETVKGNNGEVQWSYTQDVK